MPPKNPSRISPWVGITLLALAAALSAPGSESSPPHVNAYRELSKYGESAAAQLLIQEGKFDLADPAVSKHFLERLNSPGQRGDSPSTALRGLLRVQTEKTYLWLFKNYPGINPLGRMNLVNALALSEEVDAYDLRVLMIRDATFIPFPDEWRLRSYPGQLWTWRVCDIAYVSFVSGLSLAKVGLPENLPTHFAAELPRDQCDESIAKLLDWWDKNRTRVIAGRRSLAAESQEIAAALRALAPP